MNNVIETYAIYNSHLIVFVEKDDATVEELLVTGERFHGNTLPCK